MTSYITLDFLSGMPMVLWEKELVPVEQYITWPVYQYITTQCSTVRTHMPHCMQEDQAYSKPVVLDNLFPMISHLLEHTEGQTLAEF